MWIFKRKKWAQFSSRVQCKILQYTMRMGFWGVCKEFNNAFLPGCSCGRTLRLTEPRLPTSASTVKERLLGWVQAQTREYKVLCFQFSREICGFLCSMLHLHTCENGILSFVGWCVYWFRRFFPHSVGNVGIG